MLAELFLKRRDACHTYRGHQSSKCAGFVPTLLSNVADQNESVSNENMHGTHPPHEQRSRQRFSDSPFHSWQAIASRKESPSTICPHRFDSQGQVGSESLRTRRASA